PGDMRHLGRDDPLTRLFNLSHVASSLHRGPVEQAAAARANPKPSLTVGRQARLHHGRRATHPRSIHPNHALWHAVVSSSYSISFIERLTKVELALTLDK